MKECYLIKKRGLFVLTIILVFGCLFDILPNLSTDISDYKKEQKILASTHVDEFSTSRKSYKTFVMKMTDSSEYTISNEYDEYWSQIEDKKNINKKVIMYISNNSVTDVPIKLIINGMLIYDIKDGLDAKYSLLILTIGLCIYFFYDNNKKQKKTNQ